MFDFGVKRTTRAPAATRSRPLRRLRRVPHPLLPTAYAECFRPDDDPQGLRDEPGPMKPHAPRPKPQAPRPALPRPPEPAPRGTGTPRWQAARHRRAPLLHDRRRPGRVRPRPPRRPHGRRRPVERSRGRGTRRRPTTRRPPSSRCTASACTPCSCWRPWPCCCPARAGATAPGTASCTRRSAATRQRYSPPAPGPWSRSYRSSASACGSFGPRRARRARATRDAPPRRRWPCTRGSSVTS